MRIALTALVIGLAFSGAARAFEMRGFRNMAWGDGIDRLGASRRVSDDGTMTCYQRDGDNLMFGDAELRAVRYCFTQGRMVAVQLEATGRAEGLGAEFQATYGSADGVEAGSPTWGRVGGVAHARLVSDPVDAHGRLEIRAGLKAAH